MSTSLQEQLRRLALPQTKNLFDKKQRVSILFDGKEAATKDRKTIYELGVSGLQELITLKHSFKQFEYTLFDESTLNFERAVEQSDVNKLLDKNIEQFLRHLSPYFLLRPAHLCLEWLLRRFHIHDYNRRALLALAFPYHETNMFIKVLQTMQIKKSDTEWVWLRRLLKSGLHVPKSGIISRASADNAFLTFICTNTLKTIEEFGRDAHLLQTHINFYASICVGALDNATAIQEWHIYTILPSLLRGLSSEIVDFVSASFIITAQLVSRTQLKGKLCKALIDRITSVRFDVLRPTSVLLLICMFDNQTPYPNISETALMHIIEDNWFIPVLASLAKENVAVQSLCEILIRTIVKEIQREHSKSKDLKLFMEQLISDVQFSNTTANSLINCYLDAYVSPEKLSFSNQTEDIIQLDSDDDMCSGTFVKWYSMCLQKLEHYYPIAFDRAIKVALEKTTGATRNQNEAVRMALKFRLKTDTQSATDIYESLYHYSAPIRLHAIQTLISQLNDYKIRTQNYQVLRECVADRIADDSVNIVAEILKLPTSDFIDILGHEQFVKSLFSLLNKLQFDVTEWGVLSQAIVEHMTSQEIITNFDSHLILLMLMPIMFPDEITKSIHQGIIEIIQSPLINSFEFLKIIKVEEEYSKFNVIDYKRAFLDIISSDKNTINDKVLFNSVQSMGQSYFQHPTQISHFLVLLTSCLRKEITAAESLNYFKVTLSYCSGFPIKQFDKTNSLTTMKQQYVPQQLFSDFVLSLAKCTRFLNLESSVENYDISCFMEIFEYLTKETLKHTAGRSRLEWMRTLKEFLDQALPTAQAKINFFINFYSKPAAFAFSSDKEVLEMWSFKILCAILQNKSNSYKLTSEHILKIMVVLNSKYETLRCQALETLKCCLLTEHIENYLKQFIEQVLERSNEINMDCEQFPLILFTILNGGELKKQKTNMSNQVLDDIMKIFSSAETVNDVAFKAQLLNVLKHINNENIMKQLLPFATDVLDKWKRDESIKVLESPFCDIYQLIIDRITHQTINPLISGKTQIWPFLQKIFDNHDVFLIDNGKLQPMPYVLLNTLDEYTFEKMSVKEQTSFIELIMQTVAKAENDTIFLGANKLLKKCNINCEPLSELINKMCQKSQAKSKPTRNQTIKRNIVNSHTDITTTGWKEGVVLLELLENKKKLTNAAHLIPALFDLLKACIDTEEQHNIEYIMQLTLCLLLHCCQIAQSQGIDLQHLPRKATFRIDSVVQCLRVSQNPQTHNNALLLLGHCAHIVPQKVLTEIVAIFTFMGSSVVRHDDAFSFHIINNIISSIVPILVQSDKGDSVPDTLVVPVLKVFSDIMLDVPEHRRLPLYTKLMQTLGAQQYLWMFLCVVFEAHVINDEKQRNTQKNLLKNTASNIAAVDKLSKRLEIALDLTNTFEPKIVVETCIQLLNYIQKLPMQKDANTEKIINKNKLMADVTEHTLFDVQCRTAKQFRHYRYIIIQSLASITSSREFLNKIEALSPAEATEMRPYYQNFIIKTLSCVPAVNGAIENVQETSQTKFWKVILNNLHDVLNNAISLLSPEMFLLVVTGLMQHNLLSIRKKVIEILISKLQQHDSYFGTCNAEHFLNLMKPLTEIIECILEKNDTTIGTNNEMLLMQQTALIAIKLLSKLFGLVYIDEFKEILSTLTKTLKKRGSITKMLLGTIILTIIEISTNLKAHSLAYLPKYMPQMMEVLLEQTETVREHSPDIVCSAIVTGMQKLVEALPLFLGPYTVDIIVSLSSMSVRIRAQSLEKDQRATGVLQQISIIWQKIATTIPTRTIVPNCAKAYHKLNELDCFIDISMVMDLLNQSIKHSSNNDLATVQSELIIFFLHALEFRRQLFEKKYMNKTIIATTESNIIDAFVSWVLKLSETSFRPIYHKVYDWAIKRTATKQTILTYFMLTAKIADALKSLFVLFANDLIEDAARLLNECNSVKTKLADDEIDIHSDLIRAMLSTLKHIFINDSKEFINSRRFEMLMQPIVDQLENELVLESEDLQELLSSCITQLAVAVSSDMLWKQLNHAVLLKTRTNVPEVRILGFSTCVQIARKLGEDFSALLPETIPFIAELFEDENPRVEKHARKSVQELEQILGESLQKYL